MVSNLRPTSVNTARSRRTWVDIIARRAIPCALILMASCAFAQAPSNESTPTFSAGTKLVQVDVVARSKGAPATGLTKDDFTVLDNGKPQKISFFSVRSNRAAGSVSVPLPAGAVSNRTERDDESRASATVLLIDQKNTPAFTQAFAIQRIVKFVQTRRNKSDRIGIYTFGKDGTLKIVQDLTDDGELLSRAATSLSAQDPNYRSTDTEGMTDRAATEFTELLIRERAMETKQVLEATARHLAGVPGRKSLIWVSVGFPLMWPPQPGPLAADLDFNPDMDQTARILNDASVALYAVDARGLMGALNGATGISDAEHAGPRQQGLPGVPVRPAPRGRDGYPAGLDTMAKLSGLTGGLLYTNDNGIEDLIRSAMDDGELTYTLGFYPMQEAQDDWHSLKVDVTRPGVNLRYRESYFAARIAPAPAPAANDRPKIEALLKDPLDATQLRLVAETTPDPAKPGFWQVHVTVDLHDVHLEKQDDLWVGGVDVSLSIDGSRGYRTVSAKVKIPDAALAASLEKGITVNDSIDGAGLSGKLRIVAQDRATGAVGSMRVPLGR
jgi:VWFA-related protein